MWLPAVNICRVPVARYRSLALSSAVDGRFFGLADAGGGYSTLHSALLW
ncbi:hypothetical protein ACP70R_030632 [Stipagrostis hirtigluma subsp. patula]